MAVTRSDLIKKLAQRQELLSGRQVEAGVKHILDLMSQALCQQERIEIRGFGTFSVKVRRPRQARNPKTGEGIQTSPKYAIHFKPGKELRERANSPTTQDPVDEPQE